MKSAWRWLLVVPPAALALAAAAAWLALEPAPRLVGPAGQDAEALLYLRQLLHANDPRRGRPGRLVVVQVSPADLNLLAGSAAQWFGGAAEVVLGPGRLQLQASLPVPPSPFGRWLNLSLGLVDGDTLPRVERMTVGRLPVPGWLAQPLLWQALARWDRATDGAPPLHEMVKGVHLRPDRAQLVYEWRVDAAQRMLAGWLPPAQQALLQSYHERLAATLRTTRGALPLPALVSPLFALAQQRSQAGGDPAAENRAALLTLAAYVTGRRLTAVLPAARDWPHVPWRAVTLAGRIDFPQHLLVSAALAAEAGGPLADALGLAKEMSDARQGSGFSFNDMAVNRAGARLGLLAVQAPRRLQARLAAGVSAADLMPEVSDLPEFLPEAEFRRRFGGVGAPAYQRLVDTIEARVAALPLLQGD